MLQKIKDLLPQADLLDMTSTFFLADLFQSLKTESYRQFGFSAFLTSIFITYVLTLWENLPAGSAKLILSVQSNKFTVNMPDTKNF